MGAKSLYLDNRNKYKEQLKLANDLKALDGLERGFSRFKKFKNFWQIVDLDDLVMKIFKNPVYTNTGQMFEITDPESKYIIYCDNGGSYFRIGSKEIPRNNKGHYLTIDLKSSLNETIDGKIRGISKEKREMLTHFRMKIKKEKK